MEYEKVLASVYSGGLSKTNAAATNPNNPAPEMQKASHTSQSKVPADCKMELEMTKWVSSMSTGMIKGHSTDLAQFPACRGADMSTLTTL